MFVTRRTPGSSNGSRSLIEMRVAYTVGTPGNTVTPSSSTLRTVCAGKANERSSTSVAPRRVLMSSW